MIEASATIAFYHFAVPTDGPAGFPLRGTRAPSNPSIAKICWREGLHGHRAAYLVHYLSYRVGPMCLLSNQHIALRQFTPHACRDVGFRITSSIGSVAPVENDPEPTFLMSAVLGSEAILAELGRAMP